MTAFQGCIKTEWEKFFIEEELIKLHTQKNPSNLNNPILIIMMIAAQLKIKLHFTPVPSDVIHYT